MAAALSQPHQGNGMVAWRPAGMDRGMPPRIAYWTSSFESQMEGVAGEVAALRSAFPNSLVWGVSARDARWISWKHGICFNPRLYWAFRIMTGLWQRRINVNHLFGSVGDWHHLKSLINRPTIMTVCLRGRAEHSQLLERVDRFAVEWPGAKGDLKALGVGEDRIRLVLPPVDLSRFRADARPPDQFSVLFASSPDRAEWLESRGVDLILDAAQQCPEMRFVLVWRPWGDSLPAIRGLMQFRREEPIVRKGLWPFARKWRPRLRREPRL